MSDISEADVTEQVIAIVAKQLRLKPAQVLPESSYMDDLGADSLDILKLLEELEEAFEISISDQEAEKITTVQATVDSIMALKSA